MDKQSQNLAENAVAVQIFGNGNIVRICRGGAEMLLEKLHGRKKPPTSPIELLRSDIRATSLVGRDAELHDLAKWCASDDSISVRCIIGGAGSGKTRLAIETCEQAEATGWLAAFVTGSELARFDATQNLVHWVLPSHTLIVVDDAATSLPILKSWFSRLASESHDPSEYKLRILLLERHADIETGWWAELNRRQSRDRPSATDLSGKERPILLKSLDALHERRALLAETMRLAAPLLGQPDMSAKIPEADEDPEFEAKLAQNGPETEALYLIMAGIYAALHDAPSALVIGRGRLVKQMAEIELTRIEAFCQSRGFSDDGEIIKHIIACINLQKGANCKCIVDIISDELHNIGFQPSFSKEKIAKHLTDYLTIFEDEIRTIKPDLIREELIVSIIFGDKFRNSSTCEGIIFRSYDRSPVNTVESLINCAQDLSEGNENYCAIEWLNSLLEKKIPAANIAEIADLIPLSTLCLRKFALSVLERLTVECTRRSEEGDTSDLKVRLATSLWGFAIRLSDVGRDDEALTVAEQAASIFRELAEANDIFKGQLASVLTVVSSKLSGVGRSNDSLDVIEESVKLFQNLSQLFPDRYAENYGTALSSYATTLYELGWWGEALLVAEQAVDYFRASSPLKSDNIKSIFAAALSNLGGMHSQLGRPEDGEALVEEAVKIRRNLAAERPDAFMPSLAGSLNNFAVLLGKLGKIDRASSAIKEVIEIYEDLSKKQPDVFLPKLAGSLTNYSNNLSLLARNRESIEPAEKAIEIFRGLDTKRPLIHRAGLAIALNNLAVRHNDNEEGGKALPLAEEAISLRRSLASENPDKFRPFLAASLNVLSNSLELVGNLPSAISASEEAIDILLPFWLDNKDIYFEDIMRYSTSYISRCETNGTKKSHKLINAINVRLVQLKSLGLLPHNVDIELEIMPHG